MANKSKATLLSDLASILTNGGLLTAVEDRGMRTDFIDSFPTLSDNNTFTGNQTLSGLTASRLMRTNAGKVLVSSSYDEDDFVLLGGNTVGTTMIIGTVDDQILSLYVNNQERMAITNQGDAASSADIQYQNTSETHTGFYAGTEHKRHLLLTRDSTNNTPIELTTTGAAASGVNGRIEIPADTAYHVRVDVIVKQNGAADSKKFTREFCISNNAGTTALQGSVETIGSDAGNASLNACAITITANDTDDTMKIMATGINSTNLSWTATVHTTKITDR